MNILQVLRLGTWKFQRHSSVHWGADSIVYFVQIEMMLWLSTSYNEQKLKLRAFTTIFCRLIRGKVKGNVVCVGLVEQL